MAIAIQLIKYLMDDALRPVRKHRKTGCLTNDKTFVKQTFENNNLLPGKNNCH